MTIYNQGDLVEAICGESLIRDRLVKRLDSLAFGTSGGTIHWYENLGWTITVIEKAPPKVVLPVEEGFYSVVRDGGPGARILRLIGGAWEEIGAEASRFTPEVLRDSAIKEGRLTRLEPVPETAKKVLDRVLDWYTYYENRALVPFIAAIRLEFGVIA